ncbi:MAG: hypothetical protein M3443_18320 [Actinomycetota bacterium]|nr:hypothetical protein [Actinomycetota bacterium]
MATKQQQHKKPAPDPQSVIVAARKDSDGLVHYGSASAPWVVDGLRDGTVEIVEEVTSHEDGIPASGDTHQPGPGDSDT